MARRTKEDAQQTKTEILNSAMELFYEKGFARTTFDEIAKRINLTKGAVYWHFRNKTDLLAELMRRKFTEKEQKTWPDRPEVCSISELREYYARSAEAIETDPGFCKFLFFIIFQMEWSELVTSQVRQKIREITDYPQNLLKERLTFIQKSGEISADINIDDLAILLSCTWRGITDAYVSKHYPMNLRHTVLMALDLILDGIKVENK